MEYYARRSRLERWLLRMIVLFLVIMGFLPGIDLEDHFDKVISGGH
jgi:hypothetical protein